MCELSPLHNVQQSQSVMVAFSMACFEIYAELVALSEMRS